VSIEFEDVIIPTGVAHAGTTVREVFQECVTHNVLGIPFCSDQEKIIGRVSIRHTLKESCIPKHLVKGAHLLGNLIEGLRISETTIRTILDTPVDEFVIPPVAIINSSAPMVKAISIMEQCDTPYAFVVDEGVYRGVITRMGCAEIMLRVEDI